MRLQLGIENNTNGLMRLVCETVGGSKGEGPRYVHDCKATSRNDSLAFDIHQRRC
jgi:hypothetical protein